ncbi:hypothetical protein PN836_011265 [Ningiella sp. W23]|uniref:hypothetical protein n=1 Tax=Ningiella sp. W23 TaxID=3023715 RepID=UPI00375740C2
MRVIRLIVLGIFAVVSCFLQAQTKVKNSGNAETAKAAHNDVQEIVLWNRNYDQAYMYAAISNILKLSEDKYGPVKLVSSQPLEQGRAFANVANYSGLDIFVGGINRQREADAQAIYIPIDRGLLGFRLCLIHETDQNLTDIDSVEDLVNQGVSIGLGSHWPDKEIFENSGFQTVPSPVYSSLFEMLANERFDCFTRSLSEIGFELDQKAELPIKVESEIVFIYPAAEFAFVNRDNTLLQERLRYGFEKAIEDGSYFSLFEEHHQDTMMRHSVYERKLLILQNTDLSTQAVSSINQYGLASFIIN